MILLATAAIVLLQACGTRGTVEEPGPVGAAGRGQRYGATAVVLESEDHGPSLCLGAVADSLPPQCGDVPITNWRWDRVPGEEQYGTTIWGEYDVTGTYDGTSFAVESATKGSGDPGQGGSVDAIETPCPEPPGGWFAPDPTRASGRDLESATRAGRAEPDFAGLWVHYQGWADADAPLETRGMVLNVAFIGAIERHEAALRERWGGALCISRHPRTYRELVRIQSDLSPDVKSNLGLHVLVSGIDEVHNAVELTVVTIDDQTREALSLRYGEESVRVWAALRPIA